MAALDYDDITRLVISAQNGDNNAFAKLYTATCQKQYLFSCRYLQDEHMAQDALQETYIHALKNLPALKNPALFIAWLNQINFRICYNMHKKQQRINKEITDYSATANEISGNNDPHFLHAQSPEDILIRIDSAKYIMSQILQLPYTEAQAIILKYYRNMKYQEIAEYMNISLSSVKRYLRNGRNRLSAIFQSQEDQIV